MIPWPRQQTAPILPLPERGGVGFVASVPRWRWHLGSEMAGNTLPRDR